MPATRAQRRRVRTLARAVLCVGLALIVLGCAIAGSLWWEVDGSRASASASASKMVTDLHEQWQDGESTDANETGAPFATVTIARFGSDWIEPVVEGTDLAELGLGVGHQPGTAMPGQVGNFAIAGHRTTRSRPFNKIATLVKGDKIIVQTSEVTYTYTVTGHEIVKPEQVSVFDPVPNKPKAKATKALLTMSSCHPFYSAAERYVVYAELTSSVHL